jgi:sugar lactone lactonase YvrE
VTVWADEIGISNTLCWSPDRSRFYFGDTLKNSIDVFHYDDSTGDIKRIGPFFSAFGRGLPDGSAIDNEGCLWNCRFHGGCIVRVGPNGEVLTTIDLPMTNITTAVFGGADLKTLYVTTASDQKAPGDRLAGSLVAVRTGATGLAPNRVRVSPESHRSLE